MTHDMSLMFAMHAALRRELDALTEITARPGDDPRTILAGAAGWQIFKKALAAHHGAEDEALWPAMRGALTARPAGLALLDAMAAEHAAADPIIAAIDTAAADPARAGGDLADLAAGLSGVLTAHFRHEEDEALPLIDATLTAAQWQTFGAVHGARTGPDAARIVPWLLDGAPDNTVAATLAALPEPVRAAYRDQWRPAYAALDLWSA